MTLLLAVWLLVFTTLTACGAKPQQYSHVSYGMDTIITQAAYGPNAEAAMLEVEKQMKAFEENFTLFGKEGDIAKINAAAGKAPVTVSDDTLEMLDLSMALSAQSEGAFAVTIGPLTKAWGITTDEPTVPTQQQIDTLLPLVDDSQLELADGTAFLPQDGMALDLGGIAKGAYCSVAEDIYNEFDVDSAMISIGGNVYARGTKPDSTRWNIGFKDPLGDEDSYIAAFEMQDEVVAVSGGDERFFEVDGYRYIHIIDPRNGYPVESDIVSVGVIHKDGAMADFYSTTFFVLGKEKTLEYMQDDQFKIILLDKENNLYVSEVLQQSFKLKQDKAADYTLHYIKEGAQ